MDRIVGAFSYIKNDSNVLMIKRKDNPYSSYWSIPGGTVRYGESLSEAAVREVREETNLETEIIQLIGHVNFTADHDPSQLFRAYVFKSRYLSGNLRIGTEVEEAKWVEEKDIQQLRIALPILRFYEKMVSTTERPIEVNVI